MEANNIHIIRCIYEDALNNRNLEVVDTLFSPHFIDHSTPSQQAGPGGVKDYFAQVYTGFPDMQITIEDIIVDGDKIAVRTTWQGTHLGTYEGKAPTGQQVTRTMIQIFHIVDGKIVEEWNEGYGLLKRIACESV